MESTTKQLKKAKRLMEFLKLVLGALAILHTYKKITKETKLRINVLGQYEYFKLLALVTVLIRLALFNSLTLASLWYKTQANFCC